MKVLKCDSCGEVVRPRNHSGICPVCGKGKLKPYKEETKSPISVEAVFKAKAKDSNIKVQEKIL